MRFMTLPLKPLCSSVLSVYRLLLLTAHRSPLTFFGERVVHASQEVCEAGVGAQGVELRVDAEPDDPHVADGEGAFELVERAAAVAEGEVDGGEHVGRDVARGGHLDDLAERAARFGGTPGGGLGGGESREVERVRGRQFRSPARL